MSETGKQPETPPAGDPRWRIAALAKPLMEHLAEAGDDKDAQTEAEAVVLGVIGMTLATMAAIPVYFGASPRQCAQRLDGFLRMADDTAVKQLEPMLRYWSEQRARTAAETRQ